MARTALVLVLALCPLLGAFAAEPHDPPTEATRAADGLRALRDNRFSEAVTQFKVLASGTTSPRRDFFLYNLGKAYYHGGNTSEARAALDELVTKYSQSNLRPYAEYFLGNIAYTEANLRSSSEHYLTALALTTEPRLSKLATAALEALVDQNPAADLDVAHIKELPEPKRCPLAHALALVMLRQHRLDDAGRMNALCPIDRALPKAADIDTNAFRQDVRLAVVVPLSGELQSYGEELLNGVTIGLEQLGKESGHRIHLIPFDTKGDPVSAGRIVSELADANVDAIIGPLTSDEAAVASASLSCRQLPLIAPAATDAGLTLLSSSAFQLSPNLELQGMVMAEYAVRTLKADTAAIITTPNTENLTMAHAFATHFAKLGGTIIATEYYRQRDKDFGSYIRDIKNIVMGFHADTAAYVDDKGDTLELDAVPAHVNCLYMPGSADQLRQLLPQINFYSLRATYLGSDGWGDEILYALGDEVTKYALFPSPLIPGEQTEASVKLAAAYKLRYDKDPTRLALLGYDACTIIVDALRRGARSREELIREIARTTDFSGAAGRVTFGAHRENSELPVYKIRGGQAVLAETGRAPLEPAGKDNR